MVHRCLQVTSASSEAILKETKRERERETSDWCGRTISSRGHLLLSPWLHAMHDEACGPFFTSIVSHSGNIFTLSKHTHSYNR